MCGSKWFYDGCGIVVFMGVVAYSVFSIMVCGDIDEVRFVFDAMY